MSKCNKVKATSINHNFTLLLVEREFIFPVYRSDMPTLAFSPPARGIFSRSHALRGNEANQTLAFICGLMLFYFVDICEY